MSPLLQAPGSGIDCTASSVRSTTRLSRLGEPARAACVGRERLGSRLGQDKALGRRRRRRRLLWGVVMVVLLVRERWEAVTAGLSRRPKSALLLLLQREFARARRARRRRSRRDTGPRIPVRKADRGLGVHPVRRRRLGRVRLPVARVLLQLALVVLVGALIIRACGAGTRSGSGAVGQAHRRRVARRPRERDDVNGRDARRVRFVARRVDRHACDAAVSWVAGRVRARRRRSREVGGTLRLDRQDLADVVCVREAAQADLAAAPVLYWYGDTSETQRVNSGSQK